MAGLDPRRERVFQGTRVAIGQFVARPSDAWFRDSGPTRGFLVVFPRLAVRIAHAGLAWTIADPTRVMFYNRDQEYRRAEVAPEGDRCEWFSFHPDDVAAAVRPFDAAVADRPTRPFAFAWGPGTARLYALQRAIFSAARSADPLRIEETSLDVLRTAVALSYRGRTPARAGARDRELAAAVQELAGNRFCEKLSLAELARAAGCSAFHLCRAFRRATGQRIHAYIDALRLRRALELVPQRRGDLTALALDLGYASHSHFTFAFRRAYGAPPSGFPGRLPG
jgi:AraC-like DNA-binding protein